VKFENNVTKKTFIQADRKQLIRALNNLIKNAIQAIPTDVEGEVMVILDQTNSQLVLSISDNGVGIPDSEKSKIFQPYFTTKSAGTGLGLAMVKNILNEFGAKISFTSETGKGTTFMIVFG
jgi:signal transduction histidine kinase